MSHALISLDTNELVALNYAHLGSFFREHPMGANKVLDEIERKIEERYLREKAAIRLLRQTGTLGLSETSEELSVLPKPENASPAEIEDACDRIVNKSKRGYYRLSEIMNRLQNDGLGFGEKPSRFKRTVRSALKNLAKQGKIKRKVQRGRAGTLFMPKEENEQE